ncbi:hypothetical protein F5Y13DRAFT_200573 [Hypoxylon sp. FL1857]|nr:hypothetical protein F5Y13DRAFT_200573 [Hypoxylon sp. FL1857]
MYGIIAFKKGQSSPSAEFSAELGIYGRGSACKECCISRVRCSGTLDGKTCKRCKRLSKRCLYTNGQGQRRHHRNQSPDGTRKSIAATRATSPEHVTSDNNSSDTSSCSQLDLTTCDEAQLATDDALELDFEGWLQLQSTPSVSETLQPHIDSVATPPRTELPDPLCLPPLQLEEPHEDSGTYTLSVPQPTRLGDSVIGNDGMVGHELAAPQSSLDFQDWISESWTWGGESGMDSGMRAAGVEPNYNKVEDFLTLFGKSMEQLQIAEDCSMDCVLSQDLAILLLLVIEQLVQLLLSLAADPIGGARGSPQPLHPLGAQPAASDSSQHEQHIQLARVGTFETMDPLDLQMITKSLLQIRAHALDAYICRWGNKIKNYGFKGLEADLLRIREKLSRAAFFG